jgi:hypothetical protein
MAFSEASWPEHLIIFDKKCPEFRGSGSASAVTIMALEGVAGDLRRRGHNKIEVCTWRGEQILNASVNP